MKTLPRSAYLSFACSAVVLLALLAGCRRAPEATLTLRLHGSGEVPTAAELEEARETLARRLDQIGVEPAEVRTSGRDRLTMRIRWEGDTRRLQRLLTTPAIFELRFVRFPTGWPPPASREELLTHFGGALPPELEMLATEVRGKDGAVTGSWFYAVERKPILTGRDLLAARPGRGQFGDPIVEFTIKEARVPDFAAATGAHIGSFLAIVLDGRVVSAPMVKSRIGGVGMIEGGFTAEQAQDLATVLRSGPLPGTLTLETLRVERQGA